MSISTSSASGMTTTVARRGVDPAARLGRRDALDAMDAALELEAAVGAVAADLDDGLLDAVDAGLVRAQHLGLVAVGLGVAQVHPEQLGGEQRRLVATGAGPDLEDDVAVVVRVARQEQDLELVEELRLVGLQAGDLVAGHRAHVVVAVGGVAQLAGAGQLRRGSRSGGGRPRRWAPAGPAPGRAGGSRSGSALTSGVASSAWTSSYWAATSASVASRSLMPAGAARRARSAVRRPRGGGASSSVAWSRSGSSSGARSNGVEPSGTALPSATRASCIEVMATSIMSSSGRLVVIIWTRMPGYMITRTDRVVAVARPEPEDLVADRGEDRDGDQPAGDHDQRRLLADEREGRGSRA